MLVFLAAASLVLGRRVQREFSPEQPMYRAWSLIVISAACDLTGALFTQFLSAPMALNPLAHASWWSPALAAWLRQFGQSAGGSLRFAFLAAGLFQVLRVYRNSGFLARLTVPGLGLARGRRRRMSFVRPPISLYALRLGKHPAPPKSSVGPPTRSSGSCWPRVFCSTAPSARWGPAGSAVVGRPLALASHSLFSAMAAIWATAYGFLPWPWSSIGWYLWLPAAAAFALAPAYQLDAIYRAYTSRIRPQPPVSSSY